MIKVLIVDDSKFMRTNIALVLADDNTIEIIGSVRNGIEALEFINNNQVDVIILDFFMPKMDGIETLEHIMEKNPIPTIMITIVNKSEHADLYFKALKLGAFDIISKPSGIQSLYVDQMKLILKEKIHAAYNSKSKLIDAVVKFNQKEKIKEKHENKKSRTENIISTKDPIRESDLPNYNPVFHLIIIGASTGGPNKIVEIISKLIYKPNICIIIIQHMPEGFTKHFADRLNNLSEYKFVEAAQGDKIGPGKGYVAPGNYHLRLINRQNQIEIELNQNERVWGVRPCIDYVMDSAAPIFKEKCIGIILTGMGKDGSNGINSIKKYKGTTFAQNPEDALINSMPNEAIKTGSIDYVQSIPNIVGLLNHITK